MTTNKNLPGQNLLGRESSPYLLQHADNPVHWQPWNDESLALAKQTDIPILLSIGYSACHWCHVMAHESFEDDATAELMNSLFINIKVDREERPDLDKIYQNAHSLLTERAGGWPLTVFLSPDTQMPIFAGTYFPSAEKHGLPAFSDLLQQISDIWISRKTDIEQQSAALLSTYQRIYEASRPETTALNRAAIDIARNQVEKQFDNNNGGFSGAPKFPHPSIIEFGLKHWSHTKRLKQTGLQADHQILHTAIFSLEKMADGGIFDHLGGGFCRYSTDESWMIPHFEKMLYDNGPLLSLYSQAWKIKTLKTGTSPVFFDTVCETADWCIREMQSSDGGYYSSQDADSEGSEGGFFAWTDRELDTLLSQCDEEADISPETVKLFQQRFGLDRPANFEGSWHLHGYRQTSALAEEHKLNADTLRHQFTLIRRHMFQQREKRTHPETDTKILTAWNGLMIHGMSVAGRLLENQDYVASASRAAYFIKDYCWLKNQLYANYKNGKATHRGYVDDYAFLLYGLLELLQSKWDNALYEWALQLADKLLTDFQDSNYGGFFFTSHEHESLIQQLKSFSDDAIPSGNAIAAYALNRLGYLSGRQQYIEAAGNCLKSAWSSINHSPVSHCALLNTLSEYLSPPDILIIRSQPGNKDKWATLAQQYYLPFTLIYDIPADQTPHATLSDKTAAENTLAYPCSGMTCHKPIKNPAELHRYLQNNHAE